MSAALRERLRKTRRSFNASFTVAKRFKTDTEEKDTADAATGCLPETSTDCSRLQDGSENLEGNGTGHTCFKSPSQESDPCGSENSDVLQIDLGQPQSLEEKVKLEKQVQEKEELLRRLKLVKMYRSKVRQYFLVFYCGGCVLSQFRAFYKNICCQQMMTFFVCPNFRTTCLSCRL